MIGQTVNHYKITEKLGAGGMGEVFLAVDTKLDRKVALKFLPEGLQQNPEARLRLLREAKAASQLNHPNIVTIYAVESSDARDYIAMEYVDGETLTQYGRNTNPSINDILYILLGIATGLEKAHQAGIVHRDLKPDNILIDSDGRARILDFGVAKMRGAERLTKTGSTVGTVAYMSPEQVQGLDVDERSDLFSLGSILYEMIAGVQPFAGDHEAAIIYSIVNEEPAAITTHRADCPPGIAHIIERLLAKDADARYQSTSALIADLGSLSGVAVTMLSRTGPDDTLPSIAVLPFANMSADPENEFFSDGLTEELINALTRIRDLHVVARTSAFAFKGLEIDVRSIGRQLNVETVLEGSVRTAGTRIRVTAQLVKTADGYHLWSERYDREMSDVFAIQDEITQAIVKNLRVTLLGDDRQALDRRPTESVAALSLYMKGRFFWHKRTESDLHISIDYFKRAIADDPSYAMAHVGMADAFGTIGFYNFLPPKIAFTNSKRAAESALALDESLAAAHNSFAYVTYYHDWDWVRAKRGFERAIELEPRYPLTHMYYGNYLSAIESPEAGLAAFEQSARLDPLSLIANAAVGWAFYHLRDYDQALKHLRHAQTMDSNFIVARLWLGRTLTVMGRFDEAIAELEAGVGSAATSPALMAELAAAYALQGQRDKTEELLAALQGISLARYVSPHDLALVYVALGNLDTAFEQFDKAVAERTPDLVMSRVDPRLDVLRDDPRFHHLLKQVGLPQ